MRLLGAQHTTIDPKTLNPADLHYNPSIIKHRNELLMVYRWQNRTSDSITPSRLAIASLDNNYRVKCYCKLNLPDHTEDPRWLKHKDDLYLIHNGNNTIKVSKLNDRFQVLWTKQLPNQRDCEKNWVFYSYNHRIWSIYSYSPYEVWRWSDNFEVEKKLRFTNDLGWKWGEIRGGTPPFLMKNGNLLTFFHSSYNYKLPHIFDSKIYMSGYLQINPEYHQIVSISGEPVIEPDYSTTHKGPTVAHVVFPCGLIEDQGKYVVSSGRNDETCSIMTITHQELMLVDAKVVRQNVAI